MTGVANRDSHIKHYAKPVGKVSRQGTTKQLTTKGTLYNDNAKKQ